MPYVSIAVEGGLFPSDLLDRIATGDLEGQRERDFGLDGARFSDEMQGAFSDAQSYWDAFQRRLAHSHGSPGQTPATEGRGYGRGTTITRENWVIPLLERLGFDLVFQRPAPQIDGQTYAISHRAGADPLAPPVHIVAIDQPLDRRTVAPSPGGWESRRSPHALVQEFLNRSDALWGIVTDGATLRVLRDTKLLSRPTYLEFDVQAMVEGNLYSEFVLFYRLVQRSRFPADSANAHECWLERYYQQGLDEGGRVREHLRDGVEQSLRDLGTAFLVHPASEALREKLRSGRLDAAAYYRQLLRLVYRFLFLMVVEERKLLFPPAAEHPERQEIYAAYYSMTRLRDRCEHRFGDDHYSDLWEGLKQTFLLYRDDAAAHQLGLAALNGELFGDSACQDIESAGCENAVLLRALFHLSTFRDGKVRRRVNYAGLDVEELGSVYEGLLEYHPTLTFAPIPEEFPPAADAGSVGRSVAAPFGYYTPVSGDIAGVPGGIIHVVVPRGGDGAPALPVGWATFDLVAGSERKQTGSYYTPPQLVRELIESALVPVMEERLAAAESREAKEDALLDLRVCDPASGSGHFLLAAARRIARDLARVRSGEEEPDPETYRAALRDVIRSCLYAVDKNPLAVDLCKVALWIEGYNAGMPLSFLDHHVKWGDSLVGVFDLGVLSAGVPDEAYTAVTGDDKKTASEIRKRNRQERSGQLSYWGEPPSLEVGQMAQRFRALGLAEERTPYDVQRKEREYAELLHGQDAWTARVACDLWTAAFFLPQQPGRSIPTTRTVWDYLRNLRAADAQLVAAAQSLAETHPFFHWPLAFPDVFDRGGFDVVLGNPPWERIKLQEQEFFAARDPEIARAPNKAARDRLIKELSQRNPVLAAEFGGARHGAEGESEFARGSGRYPLCGRGDVNTYSLFAELNRSLIRPSGRVGCIVPSGIATDDTTRFFFQDLMASRSLASLYEFENEGFFSAGQGHMVRFALTTLTGAAEQAREADLFYQGKRMEELKDPDRHFSLTAEAIALINPNTRTCPIFRTRRDAEITKAVYHRVPVLHCQSPPAANPWDLSFLAMFHMANDSHLFRTREQLERAGCRAQGNIFTSGEWHYLPLYEAKMIYQYDHRYGDYALLPPEARAHVLPEVRLTQRQDLHYAPSPRYWVPKGDVDERLAARWEREWLIGWRDVTDARASARTVISTVLPRAGAGHTLPLMLPNGAGAAGVAGLLANLSAFVFDYVARQKVGGIHLTYGYLNQLPVLPPAAFDQPAPWSTGEDAGDWITPRVLALTYTTWDMAPFARDLGYHGPPFPWDEERRFLLRCELDAAFFHLYGIGWEDVDYIMETFPIVKRKDEARHGEYRTKRVILEIYDAMQRAMESGAPYRGPAELPQQPSSAGVS